MPNGGDIGGEIKVTITGDVGAEGAAPTAGAAAGTPAGGIQQMAKTTGGIFGIAKKFMPFVGLAGGLLALIKSSNVFMAVVKSLFEMIGAFVDVLLAPLMPIFAAVFKALIPLLPIFMKVSQAMIGPIVAFVTGLLKPLISFIQMIAPLITEIYAAVGKVFTTLYGSIGQVLGAIFQLILALPLAGIAFVLSFIKGFVESIAGAVGSKPEEIREFVSLIHSFVSDLVTQAADLGEVLGILTAGPFKEFFRWMQVTGLGVLKDMGDNIKKMMEIWSGKRAGTPAERFGPSILDIFKGLVGLQKGISYVPTTMPAILHPGERVLTARENVWGTGGRGLTIENLTVQVATASTYDEEFLGRIIVNQMMEELDNRTRRWL